MYRRTLFYIITALLSACSFTQSSSNPPVVEIPAQIQIIEFWDTKSGTLNTQDEVGIWQFIASAQDEILLRVVSEGSPVSITLEDNNGVFLMEGETVQVQIAQDGIYKATVHLTEEGTSRYRIGLGYADRANPDEITATPLPRVVGVPTPTPNNGNVGLFIRTITTNDEIGGIFSLDNNKHIYTFEGKVGQYINLRMDALSSSVDPILTLYNPQGRPMATDHNSGGNLSALIRNVRLSENGMYSVQLEGNGFAGNYLLTLSEGFQAWQPDKINTPIPTATIIPLQSTPTLGALTEGIRLEDHVPVVGNLPDNSDFARYSLYALAGEIISVSVSPYGRLGLRPKVEVYDPDGILIASGLSSVNPTTNQAFVQPFAVTHEGAYILFVTSEDGQSSGEYLVSYGSGITHQDTLRGRPEENIQIQANISARGLRDVFELPLSAGDVLNVAVTPNLSALDPIVELVTADGRVLARDDNSGGGRSAFINSYQVEQSGLHFLRIFDATSGQTGEYTLVWRYVNRAPTPTTVPNTIALLSFVDNLNNNEYKFYNFQGTAGQNIRIHVIANTEFDPVAALIDPDGNIVAEGDDTEVGLNPVFEATLLQDGTYTVRVSGYLSSGAYDVLVELLL